MTSKLNKRLPLYAVPSGPPVEAPPPRPSPLSQFITTCKKKAGLWGMEVGVASYQQQSGGGMRSAERSPAKGLHVAFIEKTEVKERREKFLTAKYGSHQMALIRKRLAVEMWLYDELQKLYESTDKSTPEVEVDIDELLDMDDDTQRRRHLQELLCNAKKSPHDVKKFVDDLLEKAKTL